MHNFYTPKSQVLGATTFSIRFKLLLQTFGTIRENLLVSYQPHMGNGKTRPDKGRFQDYRTGTFLSTNESKNMTGLRLVSKLWPVKSFYRGRGLVPRAQLSINCGIGCCFNNKFFWCFKINKAHSWLTTALGVYQYLPPVNIFPCCEI